MRDPDDASARGEDINGPDFWTVVAIAAIVSVCASTIHEGLGHGGMCVASRAHPVMISSVEFQCSVDTRSISAGGTLANFFAALLFFAASLQAGGYFLIFGDRQHRGLVRCNSRPLSSVAISRPLSSVAMESAAHADRAGLVLFLCIDFAEGATSDLADGFGRTHAACEKNLSDIVFHDRNPCLCCWVI